MALWEEPPEQLVVPEVGIEDFEKALKHSRSSVGALELERFGV